MLIVKALALSKFQYLASLVTIPEHIVIRQVNSMVYELFGMVKRVRLNDIYLNKNLKEGGTK